MPKDCVDAEGNRINCEWTVTILFSWADRIIDGYEADRGLNNGLSTLPLIGGQRGGGPRVGGNPQPPQPDPQPTITQPTETPCNPSGGSGSGQINYHWNPLGVGYTGGLQVDNKYLYPQAGMVLGLPSTPLGSGSITAGNGSVTPGLNYSLSFGFIMQFSWSGRLDPNQPRNSLRNGSFSFGGGFPLFAPNASASAAYVWQIQYRCR